MSIHIQQINLKGAEALSPIQTQLYVQERLQCIQQLSLPDTAITIESLAMHYGEADTVLSQRISQAISDTRGPQ